MTERDLSDDELFAIWDEHYADVNSYERPALDRDLLRAAVLADRLRASEASAGWVMVPREPTEEMLEAAAIYRRDIEVSGKNLRTSELWAAMLAASPTLGTEGGAR